MSEGTPAVGEREAASGALASPWLVPLGALIAFAGSVCGIGGGLFAVPLLHYGFRVALRRAVATALALVLATTLASTVAESLQHSSSLHWPLIGALVVGVLIGAQLGFYASERLDSRALRKVFVVVLFAVGTRIVLAPEGNGAGPGELAGAVGPAELAIAFAVGLGGGFLAPLLGVGGGLLMVPGLYLGIPWLGFPGARACSLAAAAFAAARSLFLHARAGRVERTPALLLAAGALIGAYVGVAFVHVPSLRGIGRIPLGLILWAVAVRFLLDLRRATDGGAQRR
jgi:hypothetical protein